VENVKRTAENRQPQMFEAYSSPYVQGNGLSQLQKVTKPMLSGHGGTRTSCSRKSAQKSKTDQTFAHNVKGSIKFIENVAVSVKQLLERRESELQVEKQ
jgi:hypothetical protein